MKDSTVVVAIEAELEKVPTGERTLSGPELEFEVAGGRVQEHFRTEGVDQGNLRREGSFTLIPQRATLMSESA